MSIIAIVGANWGDEGKGRMVDALAAEADFVVRYQGGANAGHTVINDRGKFVLHLLPSGVLHRQVVNVIGPGVALDLDVLARELAALAARGEPAPALKISDRVQLVLPHHRALDRLGEERLGDARFGSTGAGMAPHYADRHGRRGVRVCDLL